MSKLNRPLVSILMTAYNREKYLKAAIESVLQSSYPDFELIIVDDGSMDCTVEIAKAFESLDSRVKVYVNEKNLGDYPNRNRAAAYAKGKYLKYLDSDDLIYPHGLEVFVSAMEKFPNAGLGVGCNSLQLKEPFPVHIAQTDVLRTHFFQSGLLNCGPSGTIISRDAFVKLGGFSGKRMVGDTEFWFKIACHYDVVVAQPSLIYWRQHEGQEFFDGVRSGLYAEMNFLIIRELMENKECTLLPGERMRVLKYYKKTAARQLIKSVVQKGSIKEAIQLSRKFGLNPHDYFSSLLKMEKRLS